MSQSIDPSSDDAAMKHVEESNEIKQEIIASDNRANRQETRRWWIKLFVQPLLILFATVLAITGLGIAQHFGWVSTGGSGHSGTGGIAASQVDYICPMMCVPPQKVEGRCPKCAMELVPATKSGNDSNPYSVKLEPAARRVANIQTTAVRSVPSKRTIKSVGKLNYDEGTLKTIAAWTAGRIENLYANYTGVVVEKGDHLALFYSSKLYTSQVELLLAKKAITERSQKHSFLSEESIYKSARQRLIELGMTEDQIQQVELEGKAKSRINLCAPAGGTVIEKNAVEGEYVKEGQIIFKLADLSTVWLMLELMPEDAVFIRYGQKVAANIQSLPNKTFEGRVAFINPHVDDKTRTVGVRVVISNPDGVLRVGDYANALISVSATSTHDVNSIVYDSELANKWISPRHPHIVRADPGKCPICELELIPTSKFGYAIDSNKSEQVLVIPRKSVLAAGEHSVVYVETEPGRFEIRQVVLGPRIGGEYVVLKGLSLDEQVAISGNFLIDSQMQLAGNPSLIDPSSVKPRVDDSMSPEVIAALSKLSPEDRKLVENQRLCPVADFQLGSMGEPPKVEVNGHTIFLCCDGCRESLLKDPDKYIAKLSEIKEQKNSTKVDSPSIELPSFENMQLVADPDKTDNSTLLLVPTLMDSGKTQDDEDYSKAFEKLSQEDLKLVQKQKICPVAKLPLGSMGTPIKVDVEGRAVFICCEGCRESLLREPRKFLANLSKEGLR